MRQFSFRKTKTSDLELILNFSLNKTELFYFFPSATFPLTMEQLKQQLSRRHESITMLEGKDIVGFANFYQVEKHNIAFIGNVIIKPEKRKLGMGKKLLKYMINYGFKKLQLKEIHLSCYQENFTALSFYKNLEFKIYSSEYRYDLNKKPTQLVHMRIHNPVKITD
ncbi:MAG: GNAT family N-acetyltransferase [gamma proteobacterium symbiont of Taylorina sp.]|nr:GNAT family N-acetyltransferase [gamma proteobacterium symbiont of Taylorina sp.]